MSGCDTNLVTRDDLYKAKRQTQFIADVGTGGPTELVTNPDTGVTVPSIEKIVTDAQIQASGIDVGDYSSDLELTSYNQYVVYNRSGPNPLLFAAKPPAQGEIGTPLPYRIDSTTYPNPASDTNLTTWGTINEALVAQLISQSEADTQAWVESGVPKVTATGTAVARALNDRFADVLNALDEGISPDNTKAENNAAFLALCEKICQQGGVVEFQKGEYDLGDVQFEWHDSSLYVWYDQPVRGFRGKGVTNTKLLFDTPEGSSVFKGGAYWLRFEGLTFQSSLWAYTQDYHLLGTRVNLFDMTQLAGGTGCPRLKIDNVKAVGFNRAFSFFTWVSEISHVEAFQCRYPFIIAAGTSTQLNVCYAHDTWYGYVVGADVYTEVADLTQDSVFVRKATTYSSLNTCACDRSQKAAYVIGELYGKLESSGSEIPYDNQFTTHLGMIEFPPLVDDSGAISQKRSDGQVYIDNFYVLSNTGTFQNGDGVVNIARNNCGINLGSVTSSKGGSGGPMRDLLTFGPSVVSCNMDITGRLISSFGRMPDIRSIAGVKIDGIYQGQVVLTEEALVSQSGVGLLPMTFKAHLDEWRGNQSLRIALKGTQFVDSGAMVKLDISDFVTNSTPDTFYGSVIIKGRFDQAAPNDPVETFVTAHVNGSNNNINVALIDSNKNQGGKDIVVTFTGDSALANFSYNVDASVTTGARWVDGDDDKWLLWIE